MPRSSRAPSPRRSGRTCGWRNWKPRAWCRSLDFTGGYGPEEFSLKRAKPGKYRVEAQYFGDRRQTLAGPVTLQVRFATKSGLPEQREQIVTLRLRDRQETVFVGEFEVKE